MADKAEDKLWRWLTKWRPGKWLGHGPQVLPHRALQIEKAQEWGMTHKHEAEENCAPETAYLSSPIQMLTSNRRPSHRRKIIIGKMQVEAFREMQIHFITSPSQDGYIQKVR